MSATTITVSDIEANDTRMAGFWTSADGQGQIDMTGATLAEAKAELLEQCGDEDQIEGVLSGSLQVVE